MKRTRNKGKVKKCMVLLFIFMVGFVICAHQEAVAREKKFPVRPIAIINPLSPGGGTDVELRNLTPFLRKYLGKPVIILSKPGAGTTIGASAGATAKPNGYTLLAMPTTHGILAQEFHGTDYKLQDFEAIYGWFEGPMDINVNVNSPYKSLSDLVKAAKQKRFKAAAAGIGGMSHLQTLLLEKHTGIRARLIPYGGGGPAVAAVIRGEVDFFTGLSTTTIRFVKGKKVRQLVILGPEPLKALPDTPTMYDLGYKDWPYIPFIRGVLAPPKTPKYIVNILEAAFKKAVDDPGFRALMKKQGRPIKAFSSQQMREATDKIMKISDFYMPIMKKMTQKK